MTFGILGDLNWLALAVAALAYFALGGLWFSPVLFVKPWARAAGQTLDPAKAPGAAFYLGPLVSCVFTTVAVAMLVRATGTDTFGEAVTLGLVVGVGVAGAILFVTGFVDSQKPRKLVWAAITAGYHLLGILVVSVILSAWT